MNGDWQPKELRDSYLPAGNSFYDFISAAYSILKCNMIPYSCLGECDYIKEKGPMKQ